MPIVQQGSINTTALVVPDLYVQIVSPQNLVLNGVPTNVIGVVGTASWGPVGAASIVATMADYASAFGPIMNRKYDMGTPVATAVQQGASNFRCVRVTDGTDSAASATLVTGFVGAAAYTGSLGNSLQMTLQPGSKAGSWRLVVAMPGQTPELYDNLYGAGVAWVTLTPYTVGQVVSTTTNAYVCITGGTSGASGPTGTSNGQTDGSVHWNYIGPNTAFWTSVAAAVNNGNSPYRGPSLLLAHSIVSTASVAVPAVSTTVAFAGGTDGVTTINDGVLIGQSTVPYKGMYCLQGQGVSVAMLSDGDGGTNGASNQWTTQEAFGLANGIYMIATGPAGDTIANATAQKAASGVDSYALKLMFGDWLYWYDQTNAVTRLVSPQGFVCGRLGNLSPEQSSLNKQLYSVLGSQKSGAPGTAQAQVYAAADLQALFQVGIDVISNPQPGGSYWGVRCGHNSSSNAATNGDNYTRMTNYIAATLYAGMGLFVGQVINVSVMNQVTSTILSFLQNLLSQGQLGLNPQTGGLPFSAICNATNNPFSRTSLGYLQCDVQVQYQAVNEKFIVNIEGGQTVQVQTQTTPSGQVTA